MKTSSRWIVLIVMNLVVYGVLCFHGVGRAAPQQPQPPFASSVEQRQEMIAQLREIKDLLREQNDLLKSGKVKVVVETAE